MTSEGYFFRHEAKIDVFTELASNSKIVSVGEYKGGLACAKIKSDRFSCMIDLPGCKLFTYFALMRRSSWRVCCEVEVMVSGFYIGSELCGMPEHGTYRGTSQDTLTQRKSARPDAYKPPSTIQHCM